MQEDKNPKEVEKYPQVEARVWVSPLSCKHQYIPQSITLQTPVHHTERVGHQ